MSDGLGDYRSRVPTPEELEARKADQATKGLRGLLNSRRKLRVAKHVTAENRGNVPEYRSVPQDSLAPVSPMIGAGKPPRRPTEEEMERAARFRKQREAEAIPSLQPEAESQPEPVDRVDAAGRAPRPGTRRKISISNEVRHTRGSASIDAKDQGTEEEWQPKWPQGLSMEEMRRRIGAQQSYLDDID